MKYILNIITIASILLLVSCKNSEEGNKDVKGVSQTKTIPVEVLTASPEIFNHFFEVKANVEALQYAIISPETPGLITHIYVVEGQKVKKGDVLLSQTTSIIDAQIQGVKSQLDLAKITYDKQKTLWIDKQVGSEIQYLQAKTQYESLTEQLKTLKAQRNMKMIKAPFSGIVDQVNLKEGELASPGMQVIAMVNLNKMKFIANVSEKYLPVIRKGDKVDISFSTYPELKLTEEIYRTGNIINPSNRTFEIEVRARNVDNKLKPNMIATIKINDFVQEDALIIPSIIIKKDFEKQFIYVAEQKGDAMIARKVFVETGRSYKDKTIVTKGLNKGDKVIVKGYNTVSNGGVIEIK